MDSIRLYTCMVGKKPTHANFYVNEVAEVEHTLSRMAGGTGTSAGGEGEGRGPAGSAGAAVGGDAKGSPRLEPPTEV